MYYEVLDCKPKGGFRFLGAQSPVKNQTDKQSVHSKIRATVKLGTSTEKQEWEREDG